MNTNRERRTIIVETVVNGEVKGFVQIFENEVEANLLVKSLTDLGLKASIMLDYIKEKP